jgi:hypothetical protein
LNLQRTAGNEAVDGLLHEEEHRSPVLDVVGKGGGQPLDSGVRAEMEASLGHDLSDVRVHTDRGASSSAQAVQAKAYTAGNEIVFGSGAYAPETAEGKRTLAHELTHVVQQRSGPVDGTPASGGISLSDPSDRFEQAADAAADRALGLGGSGETHGSGSGASAVQRQTDGEEEESEEQPMA